jgi:hypothetical protein
MTTNEVDVPQAVLSIDLAYRSYDAIGVAIVDSCADRCTYELVRGHFPASEVPDPKQVAKNLVGLCEQHRIRLILLDGPQGWKDPDNGYLHARVCERELNAPAKTGLPRQVKPANYAPFVEFAIAVFDELHDQGFPRFDPEIWQQGDCAAAETLPLSAWRSLGLPCLPAKRKVKVRPRVVEGHWQMLVDRKLIHACQAIPNHDELQAIVAGLGGIALLSRQADRYRLSGSGPTRRDGVWREGYIINPQDAPKTIRTTKSNVQGSSLAAT